jgi:subtilisin family serine protease
MNKKVNKTALLLFSSINLLLILSISCFFIAETLAIADADPKIGVNIVLNTEVTDDILVNLGNVGKVLDVLPEIKAVRIKAKVSDLATIQALPYVEAVNMDAQRTGGPIDTVEVEDFSHGLSTWNLDAINVTDNSSGARTVEQDGTGVYIAVLDTGLLPTWRQYFPEERIAIEYAKCFGGGGGEMGNVSEEPNKWEHDTISHGTHVTSTIIGYSLDGTSINGVAPMATIIPVKVLNNNGHGWSSVVARGIEYIGDLKAGPLADSPVVINMSLGGPAFDAIEKAAIDYAIAQGVIIVASAGNSGEEGMGYPGAYSPVISVAAAGWSFEWQPSGNSGWWWNLDVYEDYNWTYDDDEGDDDGSDFPFYNQFYITDFSSRELAGQDLDVAAPGSWVIGPWQEQMGKTSYYFLGGTSMASPHVAGVVALMAQKKPDLTASDAESYLEASALWLPPGSRNVFTPSGNVETYSWGPDATGAGLVQADAALSAITPP